MRKYLFWEVNTFLEMRVRSKLKILKSVDFLCIYLLSIKNLNLVQNLVAKKRHVVNFERLSILINMRIELHLSLKKDWKKENFKRKITSLQGRNYVSLLILKTAYSRKKLHNLEKNEMNMENEFIIHFCFQYFITSRL